MLPLIEISSLKRRILPILDPKNGPNSSAFQAKTPSERWKQNLPHFEYS
jgi:hypothetical protein